MQIHFPFCLLRVVTVASILVSSSMVIAQVVNVNAQVVNIDFGRDENSGPYVPFEAQVGLAAAPDTAGASAFWNDSPGTLANALDSTGNQTTVGISVPHRLEFTNPHDQEVSGGTRFLMGDYIASRTDDETEDLRTGVISGLIAGNSYDLYIYGQGDNFIAPSRFPGQNVGIRIGTDVRHTSWDGVMGGDGQLVEDIEYVLFSGISADANGEITFEHFNPGIGVHGTDPSFFDSDTGAVDLDAINSAFSVINGIQIVGDFTAVLLGDVNLDGFVNFLDIAPFIAVLSSEGFQAEADCDEDGEVSFLDIFPFIAILIGS